MRYVLVPVEQTALKNTSMNSAEPYATQAGVAAFLCIEDAERARLACEQGVGEQHLMNFSSSPKP